MAKSDDLDQIFIRCIVDDPSPRAALQARGPAPTAGPLYRDRPLRG